MVKRLSQFPLMGIQLFIGCSAAQKTGEICANDRDCFDFCDGAVFLQGFNYPSDCPMVFLKSVCHVYRLRVVA